MASAAFALYGLAEDARVYNELATGWSDILAASIENVKPAMRQLSSTGVIVRHVV